MRKRLMWTLALGAVFAVGASAIATGTIFQVGNLVLNADGGVTPKALPKKTMAPVTVHVSGSISSKDGTHPPAFREAVIDFDKNGTVNAKGLPVCKGGQLTARSTSAAEKACPKSIVGKGSGEFEINFPEQAPVKTTSPLVLFNGGVSGGTTTLYIHAYLTRPIVTAVVTTVKLTKVHAGRYGIRSVSKVPVIAGGAGSTLKFSLQVHRTFTYKGKKQSYVVARCADGHFNAKIEKAIFNEEASGSVTGSSTLSGTIVKPCKSKG
jgi:hypothetical protein